MRYLALIYADQTEATAWSEEDMHRCLEAAAKYEETLKNNGHFVLAHGLEWASQATVLRKNSGKVVSTDGPLAETKEQLLGLYVLEAESREEAVAIASKLPMLDNCAIEVRAVDDPAAAAA